VFHVPYSYFFGSGKGSPTATNVVVVGVGPDVTRFSNP